MMFYSVEGGTYTDTTFQVLESLPEVYVFDTYDEARKKWWELTCRNVDICENRYFIG